MLCSLAVALVLGGAATSSAHPPPAGPPDTYVTSWDAIGTQAFSAAALTPAEGHVIFAYVAIAVYDSVMAVEGGYRPFAVDVDAPEGASAQAAVAAAAHDILVHYLPAQAADDPRPGLHGVARHASPTARRRRTASPSARTSPSRLIAMRAGDGFRASVTVHAAEPAGSREVDPDGGDAADRHLPRAHEALQPPLGRPVPAGRAAGALRASAGRRDYNEVKEIGSSTSTTRTPEQTLAARFWAEPPVQQARGSFRKFVSRPPARRPPGGAVHGDDLRRLRGRADRVLRREVPLRVLAADHRDPRGRHGRQRDDRRRSRLVSAASGHAEPPGVPERALLRHSGRGTRRRPLPRDEADRLHRPQPDGPRRPPLRDRPRTCSTTSATPASGAASTSAPRSRTGS